MPTASGKTAAGPLRYVTDTEPGIRRLRRGKGFTYVGSDGKRVTDAAKLARIRSLVIPPAWTDVWICRFPNGHLQATGRDAKGRKQYRYHALWQESQSAGKFQHVVEFGASLPRVRKVVEEHLSLTGLPRKKVLAALIRLLDVACLRVGNEEYRRANGSFGLTTLRDRHAEFQRNGLILRFRGKSGVDHQCSVEDPRLARVVRRCQELPGQRLFQYVDEAGKQRAVRSTDVNRYLRSLACGDCSAKDFRTWRGSVEALVALRELGEPESKKEADERIRAVVKQVAERLGNTQAVCRKYYIHPALFEAYREGRLAEALARGKSPLRGLSADERALLGFLEGITASP
jgi:DNA topoisomerase I